MTELQPACPNPVSVRKLLKRPCVSSHDQDAEHQPDSSSPQLQPATATPQDARATKRRALRSASIMPPQPRRNVHAASPRNQSARKRLRRTRAAGSLHPASTGTLPRGCLHKHPGPLHPALPSGTSDNAIADPLTIRLPLHDQKPHSQQRRPVHAQGLGPEHHARLADQPTTLPCNEQKPDNLLGTPNTPLAPGLGRPLLATEPACLVSNQHPFNEDQISQGKPPSYHPNDAFGGTGGMPTGNANGSSRQAPAALQLSAPLRTGRPAKKQRLRVSMSVPAADASNLRVGHLSPTLNRSAAARLLRRRPGTSAAAAGSSLAANALPVRHGHQSVPHSQSPSQFCMEHCPAAAASPGPSTATEPGMPYGTQDLSDNPLASMARTHHHAPLTCQASAPEPAAADMGRQPRVSNVRRADRSSQSCQELGPNPLASPLDNTTHAHETPSPCRDLGLLTASAMGAVTPAQHGRRLAFEGQVQGLSPATEALIMGLPLENDALSASALWQSPMVASSSLDAVMGQAEATQPLACAPPALACQHSSIGAPDCPSLLSPAPGALPCGNARTSTPHQASLLSPAPGTLPNGDASIVVPQHATPAGLEPATQPSHTCVKQSSRCIQEYRNGIQSFAVGGPEQAAAADGLQAAAGQPSAGAPGLKSSIFNQSTSAPQYQGASAGHLQDFAPCHICQVAQAFQPPGASTDHQHDLAPMQISQYASTVPTSGAPADHPCNSALTHGSHSASGQAPAAATDHSYQLFGQHLNGEPPTVHLHPHAQSLLAASQPITLPHTKSDEAMQHASPPIRPMTAQGWPSRDPRLMCLPHATHTAHPCGQAVSHTNLACSSPAESASDLQLTSAIATKPAPQSLPLPCKTSLGGLFGGLSPLACGPTKCSQAAALPLLEESSSVVLEGHRLDQAPVKFSDPFSSLDTSFPDPSQVQVAPMMPPLGERPGVVLKKYRSEWASGTFQHPFGPHDSHPDPAPDPTDGHTRPQSQHSVPLTFSSRALNPCAQSLQLTKDAPAPASMPRPYPSSSPRPGLYQPTASPTGLLMYPRHPESGIPSMLQAPGRDLQRIALKSAYRQTDSPYTAQPLKMVETSSGCGGVCTPHRPRALNRPASTWRWGLGDGTMLGSEDQKSGGSDGFSDAEDSSWEANAWYNQAESDGGVWQQGLGSDQGGAVGRKVPMGRPAGYVNAQGFSTSDIPGCQTQQAQGNGSRCEVERSHLSTHHDQHAAVESLSPLPGNIQPGHEGGTSHARASAKAWVLTRMHIPMNYPCTDDLLQCLSAIRLKAMSIPCCRCNMLTTRQLAEWPLADQPLILG